VKGEDIKDGDGVTAATPTSGLNPSACTRWVLTSIQEKAEIDSITRRKFVGNFDPESTWGTPQVAIKSLSESDL
jgi:hypothetical protein